MRSFTKIKSSQKFPNLQYLAMIIGHQLSVTIHITCPSFLLEPTLPKFVNTSKQALVMVSWRASVDFTFIDILGGGNLTDSVSSSSILKSISSFFVTCWQRMT